MNNRQVIILWLSITAVVLMTLYPPILKTVPEQHGAVISYIQAVHYEFILTEHVKNIQFGRLCLQWFIITIVAMGLMVTLKSKRQMSVNTS